MSDQTVENPDLTKPANLSAKGEQAYAAIMAHLRERNLATTSQTGGCQTFYSPTEWRDRGEEYGRNAELIIVYDGSALRSLFSLDGAVRGFEALQASEAYMAKEFPGLAPTMRAAIEQGPYASYERMAEVMTKAGFFIEECTNWYAAVYPI